MNRRRFIGAIAAMPVAAAIPALQESQTALVERFLRDPDATHLIFADGPPTIIYSTDDYWEWTPTKSCLSSKGRS